MTNEEVEKYNYHYDLAGDLAKEVMILDNVSAEKNDQTIEVAEKAIAHYNECLKISDQWVPRFFLGKIYQWLGEDRKALLYFLPAMDLEQEDADLASEASISAMNIGNIEFALQLSFEANRRSPDNPKFIGNHALNLMLNNEDEKALSWITKALELDSTDPINVRVHNLINEVMSGEKERPTFKELFKR